MIAFPHRCLTRLASHPTSPLAGEVAGVRAANPAGGGTDSTRSPAARGYIFSAHASALTVEAARKAGVSEVVVKPFPIAVLLQRIAAAIAMPRPFVVAQAYVGPDRRRIRNGGDRFNRRASDSDVTAASTVDDTDSMLRRLQDQLDGVEHKRQKAAAQRAARR